MGCQNGRNETMRTVRVGVSVAGMSAGTYRVKDDDPEILMLIDAGFARWVDAPAEPVKKTRKDRAASDEPAVTETETADSAESEGVENG